MNARAAALTVAGLTILLAAITLGTAAASPIKWVSVPLGTHQFGHLRSPETVVARAGLNEVGFKKNGHGCGCTDGPAGPVSFDVARNGSICWWAPKAFNSENMTARNGTKERSVA